MSYIKIYNTILALELTANAFRTYSALLSFMNTCTCYANVSTWKLAARVGLSEKSIARGVSELQQKQLITIVGKRHQGHRLANGYRIAPQCGGYTKVPVALLAAPMTSCCFKLCAFLLKCADKNKKAFPSLRFIAKSIGITVQTIIEQLKVLQELKIISKQHQIKMDSSFGHNLYNILEGLTIFVKKEKTRLVRVPSQIATKAATQKCNFSLQLKSCFVKTISQIQSLFRKECSKFVQTCTKPIFIIQKKIKEILRV